MGFTKALMLKSNAVPDVAVPEDLLPATPVLLKVCVHIACL